MRTVLLSVSQATEPNSTAPTASVTTIGFPPRATAPPWNIPTSEASRITDSTAVHTGHPQPRKAAKAIADMAAVWETDSEKKLPEMVISVIATAMIPINAAARMMFRRFRLGDELGCGDPADYPQDGQGGHHRQRHQHGAGAVTAGADGVGPGHDSPP